MLERQFLGVQTDPLVWRSAIKHVAEDGNIAGSRVNTDLMGPTGHRLGLDPRPAGESMRNAKARLRLLVSSVGRPHKVFFTGANQSGCHRELPLSHLPVREQQVTFLHRPPGELFG